jgi:peptidoglycan/xylan/chitin deacetylase (PgdA/CDA1 family)
MYLVKKIAFPVISAASRLIPFSAMVKWSGQKLLLPFYHTVSDEDIPHIKHLYPVRDTKLFEHDLDYLLKYYTPVSIDEILNISTEGSSPEKNIFHLSFDDGLREIYDVIAPILLRKGIPATFFVNPNFIDNQEMFYRYKASLLIDTLEKKQVAKSNLNDISNILGINSIDINMIRLALLNVNYFQKEILKTIAFLLEVDFPAFLQDTKPYLTLKQCHALQARGFKFGGHSMDHPLYKDIIMVEQLRQTIESIKWVEDHKLSNYRLFAFPFTDHGVSKAFFDSLFNTHQSYADLSFGSAGLKHDYSARHFQRLPMEGDLRSAGQILQTEYFYYLTKRLFQKNTIHRT